MTGPHRSQHTMLWYMKKKTCYFRNGRHNNRKNMTKQCTRKNSSWLDKDMIPRWNQSTNHYQVIQYLNSSSQRTRNYKNMFYYNQIYLVLLFVIFVLLSQVPIRPILSFILQVYYYRYKMFIIHLLSQSI